MGKDMWLLALMLVLVILDLLPEGPAIEDETCPHGCPIWDFDCPFCDY